MSELRYSIVDAFTAEPFSGNPTAVVLEAGGLTDGRLQTIAREFNVSETTFVSEPSVSGAAVAIRWFTPAAEVNLCGHGTIGAVHALIRSGRFVDLPDDKGTVLPIQTRSGILTVRCERLTRSGGSTFLVWLDLPQPQLRPKTIAPRIWGGLLGVPVDAFDRDLPSAQTQDGDVLVFLRSLPPLMEAAPDFRALAKFSRQQKVRGWCVATTATLTPSINVQSRFFAPAIGIDEDPVTGSVHGPLAAYLVAAGRVPLHGRSAALSCTQSNHQARAGLVRVVANQTDSANWAVRIGGECVTVMSGTLHV